MDQWFKITLYLGYFFSIIFLLVASLCFGWSRAVRSVLYMAVVVALLLQCQCTQIMKGVGWATGGSVSSSTSLHNWLTLICLVWGGILLVIPNWKKKDVGLFKQKTKSDNEKNMDD